jgi:hypothetical protein
MKAETSWTVLEKIFLYLETTHPTKNGKEWSLKDVFNIGARVLCSPRSGVAEYGKVYHKESKRGRHSQAWYRIFISFEGIAYIHGSHSSFRLIS